jgi:hypothetical protein
VKIHKIPADQTSREPNETAKKESNDVISRKFCDLIGRYNFAWTNEKNIEPVSLDDGRQILKDLTRDIISLRVSLVKIFSKETIKNVDQIISKLEKLQKHRLYLDRKSYTDFWKFGDEIFASLDSIFGKARKDIHRHKYSKD